MNISKPILIDWDTIQTVFLDMDGTLLDLHFDNYFWLEHMPHRYAEHYQIPINEAKQKLSKLSKQYAGQLEWYCIDHWSSLLGMDIIELKHQVADKIKLRQDVEKFLTKLNNLACDVVLLTNAHRKTVELKFSYTPLAPYFDHVICSHDIHIAKEQTGFWEMLQKHHSFEPATSLFIDDNYDVLDCAQAYGITHLFAIAQPDSQQPASLHPHFETIQSFSQL